MVSVWEESSQPSPPPPPPGGTRVIRYKGETERHLTCQYLARLSQFHSTVCHYKGVVSYHWYVSRPCSQHQTLRSCVNDTFDLSTCRSCHHPIDLAVRQCGRVGFLQEKSALHPHSRRHTHNSKMGWIGGDIQVVVLEMVSVLICKTAEYQQW